MTKAELLQVYSYARSLWSSFKVPEDDLDAKLMDAVWYDILRPYKMNTIFVALREYAKTSDFCNIAKVGEHCRRLTQMMNGCYQDEETVLEEIRKAINIFNKDEIFEKLSPVAQQVCGGSWQLFKWAQMDTNQVEGVVMPGLRKRIANKLQRQKDNELVYELEALADADKNLLEWED